MVPAAALRAATDRSLAVFASSHLTSALIDADLIDEFRIVTCPLFLGSGQPFLFGLASSVQLELADRTVFGSGATYHRFVRPS